MRAFLRKLVAARLHQPIEFLTLVLTVLGFIAAVASVILVLLQLNELNHTLESQAYSYVDSALLDRDKVFIENSEYRKYFRDDLPLPSDDAASKISALAELQLDSMDSFYSQSDHILWRVDRNTREAWEAYISQSFGRSQVLCQIICQDWNEYGTRIREKARTECTKKNKIKVEDKQDSNGKPFQMCTWIP